MSSSSSSMPNITTANNSNNNNHRLSYKPCPKCRGEGRRPIRTRKKKRSTATTTSSPSSSHHASVVGVADTSKNSKLRNNIPMSLCKACNGTGLIVVDNDSVHNEDPTASQKVDGTITLSKMDEDNSKNDEHYHPFVAIIGGGIGGFALAAACHHRSIPHAVFERDGSFQERTQGYGLTMQQASKQLKCLGIPSLEEDGITSTQHIVHEPDGTVVGHWGLRTWGTSKKKQGRAQEGELSLNRDTESAATNIASRNNNEDSGDCGGNTSSNNKRQNIHIARQALREHLLRQVIPDAIHWDHKLVGMKEEEVCTGKDQEKNESKPMIMLKFQRRDGAMVERRADIVVGADGIRSTVRQLLGTMKKEQQSGSGDWEKDATNRCEEHGIESDELRYLDCFVMLGIVPLTAITEVLLNGEEDDHVKRTVDDSDTEFSLQKWSPLLDGATVFQTADGTTRLYAMPYSTTEYMWQLSFPQMDESAGRTLSRHGPQALKEEALRRCGTWHDPIPQLLRATPTELVSGYPVYDRPMASLPSLLRQSERVTLIGDAAHPMSPFKGQGANQALLDALDLARTIYRFGGSAPQQSSELRTLTLDEFEVSMMERTSPKVKASAEAAKFLHSPVAIQKGNITRGAAAAIATPGAAT